ncbi:hypothetical protein MTO96_044847 [Rhipicephalus appendiculatus]
MKRPESPVPSARLGRHQRATVHMAGTPKTVSGEVVVMATTASRGRVGKLGRKVWGDSDMAASSLVTSLTFPPPTPPLTRDSSSFCASTARVYLSYGSTLPFPGDLNRRLPPQPALLAAK